MTDDAISADRMAAFYVQLSDDSRHIRKWDRKSFDGCTAFYAAGFPAPFASADERAREVLAEQLVPHLAARVREGGELNDGVFIRPSAAIAAMLAYAKEAAFTAGDVEGLPLAEVLADADRLGEAVDMGRLADASSIVDTLRRLAKHARRAALAASRPTEAGTGEVERDDADRANGIGQDELVAGLKRALQHPAGDHDGWTDAGMEDAFFRWPVVVNALNEALATPKPPVDEAMREMASAPRDGTYILAVVAAGRGRYLEHQAGRAFVIRHEGTAGDYDMGWAVYPGFGGCSDHDFSGWFPLPSALSTRNLTGDGAGA